MASDKFCKYIVNLENAKLTSDNKKVRDCADTFIKLVLYSNSKTLKDNLIKVDSQCYLYPYLTQNLTKALDGKFRIH